jgi:alkanesulfonate monooxygenase SsuD/methylene tetrahydromethanopterin reductase-like flavin-dependent oxidoreductase (luciferase family)
MELSPFQRPYPPLWYPTHNPESVVYAAQNGYNLVGLGPAAGMRVLVDSYWENWERHLPAQGRLNGHVTDPKVGIMRQVFVADTDEEAESAAHVAHGDWYRSITKLWHDFDDHTYDGFFNWETSTQYETIIFGSPPRVRDQIARLLEESGCNYVVCSFAWGSFTHEQALRSLNLFAEEVLPAF